MKRKGLVQQTDRLSGDAEATAPARNALTIREQLRTLRDRYTHIAQAIQSLEKLQEPRGEEAAGMVTGSISRSARAGKYHARHGSARAFCGNGRRMSRSAERSKATSGRPR
jgi:hypothetical protein